MDERSYNTPSFSEDTEYTECEDCSGDGYFIVNDSDDPNDYQPIKEDCCRCEGSGQLPIE